MDIILEENSLVDQIKKPEKKNQKESSMSSSFNFERLYSELVEAQSDIESIDEGIQKFFTQYLENITNPNEIKNIVKIIKQNNAFQEKMYGTFKLFLEADLKENKEKAEKGIKITKQIETKTYQVARAKDMFLELNNMIHGDIISHQKEIKKISNEIKVIQQQVADYEKEIEVLNAENKKTYSEELNLLDTVMSFGKKLYTTYVTREEKKKEKNKLEAELNQLKEEKKAKDEKYQEALDNIKKREEKAEKEFQEQKREIELFLESFPPKSEECEKILNALKKFCSSKLKKYNTLKQSQNEKSSKDININTNQLKEHINCCDNKIVEELLSQIEIIRNIHPYLSIPPMVDINNVIDTVESLTNQISFLINEETPQEKINNEREKQMEEIGEKISDLYYDKFIKHIFFNSLKANYEEEKKKKEAEKKMKELKNKEEKLKQLQMKYINEQGSISSQNSQISNSSCNSINEDFSNISNITTNIDTSIESINKKSYPPSPKYSIKSSSSTISKSNNINIQNKEKKKEEKKKSKMPYINVIIEEDSSKSKTDTKKGKEKDNEKFEVEKKEKIEKEKEKEKEKQNETTEKKSNFRQKSYKKKPKASQNKKRKTKKTKKFNDLDKNIDINENENSHIFTQMLVEDNNSKKKYSEKGKDKEKKTDNYYASDSRKNKNQFNFPQNNFNKNEDISGSVIGDNFDLNDINFLTELGEELNKSEKNYAYTRKNYFRK